MLDLSTEFKQEMFNDNRNFLVFLNITLTDGTILNITNEEIWQNSLKIEDATSTSGKFSIGAAVTGKMTVTLNNIYEKFSEYDFANAAVIAYIGLQLSAKLEKIRVGTYIVDEPSYDGSTITLSCLDNMAKLDTPYKGSTLNYPANLSEVVQDICACCGISMLSADFSNRNYVVQERPTDDALTFGDILAMVAQVAGCWAKMDEYGRLKLDWYNMSVFEENASLNGGKFDSNTPYKTGDKTDGGNFTDYSSGDWLDGGVFNDQKKYHHIFSTKSFSMSTDDVVITGVRVTEEFEETETKVKQMYLAGTEGYVIDISGNMLIQQGNAEMVAEYLYDRVGGMRFRPIAVEALGNPSIEAGDIAYVTDRKQNSYQIFISTREFNLGGVQKVTCDAETPLRNRAKQYSEMTKAIVKARNESKKNLAAYDLAIQQLTSLMTQSFGVFKTEEKQEDGSSIYYLHNKPDLATSSTIWKMTADAFAVSTDGGDTWNAGIDSSGNAVVNVLSAVGINADWIKTGELLSIIINNGNGAFTVDANGNVKIKKGSIIINDGVFSVDENGKLISSEAMITGNLNGCTISNGDGTFFVDEYGNVIAKNATIFGNLYGVDDLYLYNKAYQQNLKFVGMYYTTEDPQFRYYRPDGKMFMQVTTQSNGVYFPLLAHFKNVLVDSLDTYEVSIEGIAGATASGVAVKGKIRHSGVFVSFYGKVFIKSLEAGETISFHPYAVNPDDPTDIFYVLSTDIAYVPSHKSVRTVSYYGKRAIVFVFGTDGVLDVKNASETDITGDSLKEINFRMDYFMT